MAKTFLDKNNKKLFEVYETKEIVANPVLSGGEASLTSFQVGETKYKIDGGGGGGTTYTAGEGIDIDGNNVISNTTIYALIELDVSVSRIRPAQLRALLEDNEGIPVDPKNGVILLYGPGDDYYYLRPSKWEWKEVEDSDDGEYTYEYTSNVVNGKYWKLTFTASSFESIVPCTIEEVSAGSVTVTDIKLLDDEDCFALNPGDIVLEEETISSEIPIQAKQYTPYTVSYKFTGSGSDSYTFAELALTNAEAQQIKTVIYNYDGTQSVGSQWYYTETIVTALNTTNITTLTNDQCNSLKIGDKVLEQVTTELDVTNTLYSVSNYTEDAGLNLKTLELVSVNKSQISTVTYQKDIVPPRGINDWVYIGTQVFSVSANPVSTTETLNSIEINGTNYAIAGGGSSGMDITAQEIEEYFDEYCDIQAEVTEETIEGEDVNVLNLENVDLENEAEYLGLDLNASNVSAANKILDIEGGITNE